MALTLLFLFTWIISAVTYFTTRFGNCSSGDAEIETGLVLTELKYFNEENVTFEKQKYVLQRVGTRREMNLLTRYEVVLPLKTQIWPPVWILLLPKFLHLVYLWVPGKWSDATVAGK